MSQLLDAPSVINGQPPVSTATTITSSTNDVENLTLSEKIQEITKHVSVDNSNFNDINKKIIGEIIKETKDLSSSRRMEILTSLKRDMETYRGSCAQEINLIVDSLYKQEEALCLIDDSNILDGITEEFPQFNGKKVYSENLWKMCLDQDRWEGGRYSFENERGYMNGMYNGMKTMLENIQSPITSDLIRDLHDACVDGVMKEDGTGELLKGYRKEANGFGLNIGKNCSLNGFTEIASNNIKPKCYNISNGFLSTEEPKSDRECHDICSQILNNYNMNKGIMSEDVEKIRLIASTCRLLEDSHLFSDGNARTLGFVVINKMLIENKLIPTILTNPNHLDGYSIDELTREIIEGQRTFMSLLENKQDPKQVIMEGGIQV